MLNLFRSWRKHRPADSLRRTSAAVPPQLEELESRLAPSVDGLSAAGLPDVMPNLMVVPASAVQAAGLPGQPAGFSPQQIQQAYGFNQISFDNGTIAGDGSGQTIAIVDPYSQPNIVNDLAVFDSTYGIAPPPSFTVVNQNGGSTLPAGDRLWGIEESLDVEWAHAMAPGAKIVLVEANSNNWSDLLTAVNYARNLPGVSVVSMSWGSSEWSTQSSFDGYFTTPSGHNGVSFVAASGDSGSTGAPTYPAISPNVLAVGGTQLGLRNNTDYGSETGWSGSSGGMSAYYLRPGYQKNIVTQAGASRASPDVAYDASTYSPFAIYDSYPYGGWLTVGGTSAGAPQWAALLAIANQGRALDGLSTLDGVHQTLPAIYQLPASDFHDVTAGSNGSYAAGPGYDPVTGRGTPIANQVVAGLVSYGMPIPPSPSPWVMKAASATPNPVTGRTANLSVQGSEDGGASGLTYTWWTVGGPAGARLPTFSVNGTNAAQNTTATFYLAGTYILRATITDANGKTTSSDVTVTVQQTLGSVGITPANASVADGGTQQFTAVARDQFGNSLSTQPTGWTWKLLSGAGTLSSSGLYTAPLSGTGTATVQATGVGLTGSTNLTYGPAPAAPSSLSTAVVSAQQVNLAWRDNSSNETGFLVQRSTNGGAWTLIARTSAGVTSWADRTVSSGKKYSYRVAAYDRFGNSAFSNTTAAITPAVSPAGVIAAVQPQAVLDGPAVPLAGSASDPGPVSEDALWLTWSNELEQNLFDQQQASLLDAVVRTAWGYRPSHTSSDANA